MNIVVLSTFDIWPPRDGGQSRYYNIWRNFTASNKIKILAYDFRNLAGNRRYRIAPNVEVVVPAASKHDAQVFHQMAAQTGLWLHDVLCLRKYRFSSDFVQTLACLMRSADVVVASHPYLASVAFPFARSGTLKVYESYNVELDIKRDYFKQGASAQVLASLLEDVRVFEERAARLSDKVTVVSRDDQQRFQSVYDIPSSKISLVPNGANVKAPVNLDRTAKTLLRRAMGIGDQLVGVFLGSAYPGNVESYRQARLMLDQCGFAGTVLIVGSIVNANRERWPVVRYEERWLGFVEEELKDAVLSLADFAVHLMFSGAGTNLKLFDYMAAGIPIFANAFGRRGIDGHNWCVPVETVDELNDALSSFQAEGFSSEHLVREAQLIVKANFDWRSISSHFERLLGGVAVASESRSQEGDDV